MEGPGGAGALGRLGAWEQARWSLSLYERAGEAGGCFVSARARAGGVGVRGMAADPERARLEAARRARAKVRRYCAANGLNRFGTLTYAPPFCTDAGALRDDLGVFFRGLRDGLGAGAWPYVWVPELHADGQRFHAHYAMGRFVPRGLIEDTWGHGFIKIKLIGDLPVGSGAWEESRVAARYLAKYVSKTFEHPEHFGRHRYDVAQGFQPVAQRIEGTARDEVIDAASERMNARPQRVWLSDGEPGWRGAPSFWVAW